MGFPDGLDSGLHAEALGHHSGLLHAGENWTAPSLFIDPHAHPGWELYLQLHGTSRWTFGTEARVLGPGWAVAVPPGLEHGHDPAAGPQRRHHYVYAAFDQAAVASRAPALGQPWLEPMLFVSPTGWSLQPVVRALLREVAHERPLAAIALETTLDLLLVEATRVFQDRSSPVRRMPGNPAVARPKSLLDESPSRPWTLEALAAAVGLSRAHLSERFAAEVGQPPHAYLLERRVERAADLLAGTDRDISDVSADARFSSGSSMARTFRSVLDCSPAQWRRQARASGH